MRDWRNPKATDVLTKVGGLPLTREMVYALTLLTQQPCGPEVGVMAGTFKALERRKLARRHAFRRWRILKAGRELLGLPF